jgi:type II secretory pathway pseudopilin PulG
MIEFLAVLALVSAVTLVLSPPAIQHVRDRRRARRRDEAIRTELASFTPRARAELLRLFAEADAMNIDPATDYLIEQQKGGNP